MTATLTEVAGPRHFLDLLDWDGEQIDKLLREALRMKKARQRGKDMPLKPRRVLGLIFEKPSLRTRVSFQTAMVHLGGASVFLSNSEVGLGQRESLPDVARTVSQFVDAHPTVKVLALSFLLLIGVSLIADGFGAHIPKGYIYFAMGFSVFVEMINLRVRGARSPVKLHRPYVPDKET